MLVSKHARNSSWCKRRRKAWFCGVLSPPGGRARVFSQAVRSSFKQGHVLQKDKYFCKSAENRMGGQTRTLVSTRHLKHAVKICLFILSPSAVCFHPECVLTAKHKMLLGSRNTFGHLRTSCCCWTNVLLSNKLRRVRDAFESFFCSMNRDPLAALFGFIGCSEKCKLDLITNLFFFFFIGAVETLLFVLPAREASFVITIIP